MVRAFAVLAIVVAVGAAIAWFINANWPKNRSIGREVVMDEVIRGRAARDNYVLLQRYDRFVERLLEADATLPMLNDHLKKEAEALRREYTSPPQLGR